jgi:UDP-N-acetylmuramoylalanine--D-glutamate ligase
VIAVTGSDGKTTTTTIISELLKAAGYRVHVGGNIGRPLLCDTPQMQPEDYVVLELSSFQLHSMFCRPDVAVITNLTPNHLDKHKDFQDYIDAKRAIYEHQNPDGRLILNADDTHTDYYRSTAPGQVSLFSDRQFVSQGTMLKDGVLCWMSGGAAEPIVRAEEIRIPGEHNVLNYLAAFEAVRGLVDAETCRGVARSFPGVAHRLELVRELHGVRYINDSIGSSPTRTIAGLHALKTKPIILCGGYDKKIPFDTLGDELCLHAKAVVLTGHTAEKIHAAILASPHYASSGVTMIMESDFREAVLTASRMAKEGDIVLLSPACASFDHFRNFEERGNTYKQIVMELE